MMRFYSPRKLVEQELFTYSLCELASARHFKRLRKRAEVTPPPTLTEYTLVT